MYIHRDCLYINVLVQFAIINYCIMSLQSIESIQRATCHVMETTTVATRLPVLAVWYRCSTAEKPRTCAMRNPTVVRSSSPPIEPGQVGDKIGNCRLLIDMHYYLDVIISHIYIYISFIYLFTLVLLT